MLDRLQALKTGVRRPSPRHSIRCPRKRFRRRESLLVGLLALLLPAFLSAQTSPREMFRTSCTACHTIGGGRLVGPDLKDVSQRQERAWLVEFIVDPQSKIESQDPYALQILAEAKGVQMVPVPGVTAQVAESLLDLIDAESTLEKSEFSGPEKLRDPTPEDALAGGQLFTGERTLLAGGPACISCHLVSGLGGLGGGRLGPDLTKAGERLGGLVGLYTWLKSPPTAQMKATFQKHPLADDEVFALSAYLGEVAEGRETRVFSDMTTVTFGSIGLIGAMVVFVSFGGFWWGRLGRVRVPMIKAANRRSRRIELHSGGKNG